MLVENIKTILTERVLKSAPTGTIVLEEPGVMTVSIVEVPTNAVVIEMHSIRSPSGIKNGIWKRSCDYMIVFRSGEQDGVLFVELKQTLRDGNTEGHEQLRRSRPILDYLDRMCAVHFKTDLALPEVRYVLIGKRNNLRIDKRRVRPGQEPQVDDHENIKVTSLLGPSVAFATIWPA